MKQKCAAENHDSRVSLSGTRAPRHLGGLQEILWWKPASGRYRSTEVSRNSTSESSQEAYMATESEKALWWIGLGASIIVAGAAVAFATDRNGNGHAKPLRTVDKVDREPVHGPLVRNCAESESVRGRLRGRYHGALRASRGRAGRSGEFLPHFQRKEANDTRRGESR